jgi:thiamine biosynthesis protein ThiS
MMNDEVSIPHSSFRIPASGFRICTGGDVEITVNAEPRRVAAGITVGQLLEDLHLAGKLVAVEVNLQLVPHQRRGEHHLAAGDRVEIVTLVGGG